ncbi:MAG: aldolase/citrate lyase family protein [Devosia sp.]
MTLYPPNALKRKLAERKPALGFWLSLNSLGVTEIAAGAGFDWLLLDAEHALHNVESLGQHVLAAQHPRGDTELVVRVPDTDPVLMKGLLDAGVRSFMLPFVQTLEEARLAVAATRYPPKGIRGYSGTTRASHWGRDTTYNATYENDICVILQIESPQAASNIPAYSAIEGVDAMLIGANDLAANMGHLGDTSHPEVVAALNAAGDAIIKTGKAAGFQFFDRQMARHLLGRGFTLAAVEGDISAVRQTTDEVLATLRSS